MQLRDYLTQETIDDMFKVARKNHPKKTFRKKSKAPAPNKQEK